MKNLVAFSVGPALAMPIIQFDKMADKDQAAYFGLFDA